MSTPTAKTHTLNLNNGAIHHLAQVLAIPGLLTDPADLFRAGQILEEHLIELPKPAEFAKGTDEINAVQVVRKWQRVGAHIITLSERQRETAKKATKAACEKGNMPPGPALTCLLIELGLVEIEGA